VQFTGALAAHVSNNEVPAGIRPSLAATLTEKLRYILRKEQEKDIRAALTEEPHFHRYKQCNNPEATRRAFVQDDAGRVGGGRGPCAGCGGRMSDVADPDEAEVKARCLNRICAYVLPEQNLWLIRAAGE
jgi:hypothetical protein